LLAVLTATFFLAEQSLVSIEFRRQSYSLTFAGVPIAVGILLFPLHELVLARLVGSLAALLLQRISSEKVVYNTSAFIFEAALSATAVHLWLPSSNALSLADAGLLIGCIAAGDQFMSLLVLWVIKVHAGPVTRHEVAEVLISSLILSLVATVFGTAVTLLMRHGLLGDLLVFALLTLAIVIYRSYASTTRRHQSLELVHEFVAKGVGADSLGSLGVQSLTQIRHLLRASKVELVLTNESEHNTYDDVEGTGDFLLLKVGEEDELSVVRTRSEACDWVRSKALQTGDPTLAPRGVKDVALQRWLQQCGLRDALVVPMSVGSEPLGVITVSDRLGDTATFTNDDLTLLQTLISHLAVAIRSTRLVEKLGHDATHDSLTGLVNRAYLGARISSQLANTSSRIAVLLLDLDKFKEVNDVLGHHVGDRLLTVVAQRLRECLPESATIARLGGDEFAVLLTDLGEDPIATATAIADRAVAALMHPVRFEEALLTPEASIGIAISTGHGSTDLLRHADTAMYVAKSSDQSIAVYQPEMDQGRAQRLALLADLRVAVETHPEQFAVYYQPKIDITSGKVVSAEALVRWSHPSLGIVNPDQFIPLAEATGLIERLTAHVLSTALAECAQWVNSGHDISVAVNLSPRTVAQQDLPALVQRMLSAAGLSPDRLILEITESSVMGEPERTVPVLNRLAADGICLSLDDFGTGYSSLSYLQRLPVRELKIDRSFVAGLTSDDAVSSRALIRSMTALAVNLGLRVVAEGIEEKRQLDELAALGCHVAQGYLISRPLPPSDLHQWLRAHHSGSATRLRLVTASA
jgi:diguanylate cyclase (GGDEF)-like protein